jgi:uncharacterized YccA/Bax inhibitor family protein
MANDEKEKKTWQDELRTSNPAWRNDVFQRQGESVGQVMTIEGTINKTAILLACVGLASMWTWRLHATSPDSVGPVVMAGALTAFVVGLVAIVRPQSAPIAAPIYATFEGFALGALSGWMDSVYPGIAGQAVVLTFSILGAMLVVYRSGAISVTDNFKIGVASATGGIAVFYLVALVSQWAGGSVGATLISGSGFYGILFSVIVIGVAALNFVMDFDLIEKGVAAGAPQYMEWYAAFGLMVTLIWVYLEVLRLLGKLRRR